MVGTYLTLLVLSVTLPFGTCARNFIDLTYAFNNETVLFPGRRSTFSVEAEGYTPAGFWIASKALCISEHTGTHIDAPYHFHEHGKTLDQIPLEDFIDIPGVMIDIYDKVHTYDKKTKAFAIAQNYALTRQDILEWEKVNGRIPSRSVVMVRSGWGERWPNAHEYQGLPPTERPPPSTTPDPTQGNTVDLNAPVNYPGFDTSAATFLASERGVLGVGIDTLSIDPGTAKTFPAHQIFAARSIYMLENVANLHLVPPTGFRLWLLPFKIDRGTGAPVRILASIDNKL